MSTVYESEQAELKQEAARIESEFAEEKQTISNTEQFLAAVRSYTEIVTLSPVILNEFIDKIVVHAPDKSSGHRQQKVEIYYNSVGILSMPSEDEMVTYLKEHKRKRLKNQAKAEIQIETA